MFLPFRQMKLIYYAQRVHVHSMEQGWDGNEKCVYVWFLGVCVCVRACVLAEFLIYKNKM